MYKEIPFFKQKNINISTVFNDAYLSTNRSLLSKLTKRSLLFSILLRVLVVAKHRSFMRAFHEKI